MFKLVYEFFSSIFLISTQIINILIFSFIYVAVAYGWSTQEHREMVPYRNDFDLSHEQFNVGKGDTFTGERDRWRYAHLLVAADFFQNWTDFRNASRTIVINARETIDQNNHGSTLGNSNHDLITVLRGNINFIDVFGNNRDHFQPYAQRRWRNNHSEAINMARDSLYGALAYNGFADHFLADTFAAGHQIDYAEYRQGGGRTGVKNEHDRLSKTGLQAQNDNGDQWLMLGDGYFHKMEQKGQDITIEAIALSIDDIFLAASGKNVPIINGKYRAERLIPYTNYDNDALDTSATGTVPRPPIYGTEVYFYCYGIVQSGKNTGKKLCMGVFQEPTSDKAKGFCAAHGYPSFEWSSSTNKFVAPPPYNTPSTIPDWVNPKTADALWWKMDDRRTGCNLSTLQTFSLASMPSKFTYGYGIKPCGCWEGNPPPIAPDPRCQSGRVFMALCPGYCTNGVVPHGYLCQ